MIAYYCGGQPIMSHVRKIILTSSDFSLALCQLYNLETVMKKVAAG